MVIFMIVVIVFELCEQGNIYDYIKKNYEKNQLKKKSNKR